MPRLQDKVAIITGAGSGIGRQAALLFAREGAIVVVADVNEETGERTVQDVTASGGQAAFVRTDVAKAADIEALVRAGEERYGKVDVMFNNAGLFAEGDASVIDTPEEVWDLVMNINLKSVYLGCKYAIPAMLRAGGGAIINTASFVALMGAATSQIAYTATKGGVLALTREVAVEFARQNIRANALCPGPVDTPLLQSILHDPVQRQRRMVHIPIGRPAEASEIASAALFLASDESSYITGATFTVDGGITAAYVTPD